MTETLDQPQEERVYQQAGFGHRFAAFLIDTILLGIINFGIGFAFNGAGSISEMFNAEADPRETIRNQFASPATYIGYVLFVLYFMLMESSESRATLGKMALGLIAVDPLGNRIDTGTSLTRNVIRFFEANLGSLLYAVYILVIATGDITPVQAMLSLPFMLIGYIGFFMALGPAKTTLHDRISGTYVVFKDR